MPITSDRSLFAERIAGELSVPPRGVAAVLELLAEDATIPFIARYRKERTGGLDETLLRAVRDRAEELAAIDKRRASMLGSLEERGLLTDELRGLLESADTQAELEDRYLPYRPKRRTRATAAREAGLEPAAVALIEDPALSPARAVEGSYGEGQPTADRDAAIAGVGDIVAEWISEDAAVRGELRTLFAERAIFDVRPARGTDVDSAAARVFADYFGWSRQATKAASHQVLAILRGVREKVLSVHALPPHEAARRSIERVYLDRHDCRRGNPDRRDFLVSVGEDAYTRLIAPSLEKETLQAAKREADVVAADVFAANLRDLLMEAPLGAKPVIALDPGFRTGCKLVCLDSGGRPVHHETIFPLEPQRRAEEARDRIRALLQSHQPSAVCVGNGTGGREAEAFLRDVVAGVAADGAAAEGAPIPAIVMVDESGASVYSASAIARDEFPNLDVTVRGAISIGRRLMDPLVELVKIDPASIGVGQYQHDVDEALLRRKLDDTVRSCVAAVGVDLNLAGVPLLSYVPGLTAKTSAKIVEWREKRGPFASRSRLASVAGIGPKTFEQAAAFLRVYEGDEPLDATAVHPERYDVVRRMAADLGVAPMRLVGDPAAVATIETTRYVSDDVGIPTLTDIVTELSRPGRDPRPRFEHFSFAEAVHSIDDLTPGLVLMGKVTNITDFGAFVDIGVHRDGLVHVSRLSDRFVRDPREVVRVHQTVRVKVVEVDHERNRISLSMTDIGTGG